MWDSPHFLPWFCYQGCGGRPDFPDDGADQIDGDDRAAFVVSHENQLALGIVQQPVGPPADLGKRTGQVLVLGGQPPAARRDLWDFMPALPPALLGGP